MPLYRGVGAAFLVVAMLGGKIFPERLVLLRAAADVGHRDC